MHDTVLPTWPSHSAHCCQPTAIKYSVNSKISGLSGLGTIKNDKIFALYANVSKIYFHLQSENSYLSII